MSKAYWRQDLGTEAARAVLKYGFRVLYLPRLICLIDPENRASARVAEKIGMTFEREVEDRFGRSLLYAASREIRKDLDEGLT